MTFKQAPIQAKGNRALFGNKSGIQIGFDWNDSRSFSPAFDSSKRSVSWQVGGTFDIDPTTIATSNTQQTFEYSDNKNEPCYANGRYWVFYGDFTNWGWVTSKDGISWSA